MAAEMSCLTGVDGDDKDADPDINALILLQEPVKMTEKSIPSNDSFYKPSQQQSSVLDVLSNTDMLSPVGLGNGLSLHEATQADDVNTITIEKDEEKSITQLKTVQDIDTAGIWGFDVESPENSSDGLSSTSDLQWDPRREFMHFLWENHSDSSGEEPKKELQSLNSQSRRKRKMDMVMMVDPTEDLCPDLTHKSSQDFSDKEDHVDSISLNVRQSRTIFKFQTSQTANVPNYPNGTMKAIKQVLRSAPGRHSHEDNPSRGLSPFKGRLMINSHSEERASCYPCSKCKLIFKKGHHLQRHMKSHEDPPNNLPKTFICRECGESFRQSSVLIEHVNIHHEKRSTLPDKLKGWTDDNEDNDAKLFCPQCPFGTNCPKTFVQHAKTHAKDKRIFKCDKCNFRTLSWADLRRHIIQHTDYAVRKQIRANQSDIFSCNICTYKAFSKTIFKNHLWRRHQLELEEYQVEQFGEIDAQPSEELHIPPRTPVEDAELTSKIMIKNQVSLKRDSATESNDILDLFKNNKMKRGLKSQLTESKLDKSINVLLSRQKHGKNTAEQMKSAHDSTSGNNSDLGAATPDKEDTTLSTNGLTGSSHGAERVPNRGSLPNCIPDQSPIKKSPSKRKMSTPYRNMSDQESCFVSPNPLPSPKRLNQGDLEDCNKKDIFHFKDADDLENGVNQENHNIIYTYSRRMSIRGALQASKRLFEKVKTEDQDDKDPTIKEECIETEVFQEAFESPPMPLTESYADDMPKLDLDCKNCPYCPAIFQSGVSLSNHVRGHLHRVGLTYTARHVLTPEQVACEDRPKVRRKIASFRKLKKVLQLQPDSEETDTHSCPLCGDVFDNRKGQSNHVRGHLKKIGRAHLSKNKSPIIVLKELMRNKKEYLRAVHILGKRRNNFHYGANNFTPSSYGIPQDNTDSRVCADVKPLIPAFSILETDSGRRQIQTKVEEQDSLTDTTALIGILKKRKCQDETKPKGMVNISRYSVAVSSNGEQSSGTRVVSSLPIPISEKGEFNRKVCVHCGATFHSGVSLSNHLRACAKRKRMALLEGTEVDCKARRQRLRPSSKKKVTPLTQTPEEMYRLTCRFCDLVFQGPLSVQEDWIKHLQRHIMNTGVPHTGLGMVEVTSLQTTGLASCVKTDPESLQPTNALAAS
ncbi:zinc finger protein 644a isoform X2 [Phyllopteryx taeniolatus]|nr:zinc finger protein 644a isoform X2 [Phyllopteryx taeniolatus]XP_061654391.1 zinc finger protein 644a isoform X2 [Phyllopteryx taeniolatus]XP_061654392.1 zinc finger protein 644a isoform X2 [Phyllopteryx taeniolatus]